MLQTAVERLTQVHSRSLYLPQRGVMVDLPPDSINAVNICSDTGRVTLDPMERVRFKAIIKDSILENRYSTPQLGEQYMERVSPQWRDRLLAEADMVAGEIKQKCWSIGKDRFAILLYGSVAKNLAKFRIDEDPSNIDIALIGDFSDLEKSELMDLVRPIRQKTTTKIKAAELCRCETVRCRCYETIATQYWTKVTSGIEKPETYRNSELIERVCVIVQTPDTLRGYGYGGARRYISSSARALYDPHDLWREIESEALAYMNLTPAIRRKVREGRWSGFELDPIFSSWNTSPRFQEDPGMVDRLVCSLRQIP